ncbi:zinc-ribbon domain-containing protein [Flavonifractor plautii]|nr:zinc-ribbon domain-containing protein [Flavonifractor plautii]
MAGQCAVTNQSGKRLPGLCLSKQIIPGENDLASQFPQLAAQWHPDKNGALRPENVSPNSNRKVWWLCPLGHAWKATVTSRSREGRVSLLRRAEGLARL